MRLGKLNVPCEVEIALRSSDTESVETYFQYRLLVKLTVYPNVAGNPGEPAGKVKLFVCVTTPTLNEISSAAVANTEIVPPVGLITVSYTHLTLPTTPYV